MKIITKLGEMIINGGNINIGSNRIIVNGKTILQDFGEHVTIDVQGDLASLSAAGDVNVTGAVNGNVDVTGDLTCGNISGDADVVGDIECGDVGGDIDSVGNIRMKR